MKARQTRLMGGERQTLCWLSNCAARSAATGARAACLSRG